MEMGSQSTLFHSLSLAVPFGFLFFNTILIWLARFRKFSLRLFSLIKPHTVFLACSSRGQATKIAEPDVRRDLQLSREDVKMVMGCMGMDYSREGEQTMELMGFEELETMFVEKELSLEEVQAAFSVFDVNCDGFIDSTELQKVLSKLGFIEGLALDACQQMIANHDDDKDGRIGFHEFVKLMESSFC